MHRRILTSHTYYPDTTGLHLSFARTMHTKNLFAISNKLDIIDLKLVTTTTKKIIAKDLSEFLLKNAATYL